MTPPDTPPTDTMLSKPDWTSGGADLETRPRPMFAPPMSVRALPIKRNKLGIGVAAFTSSISVALIGLGFMFIGGLVSGLRLFGESTLNAAASNADIIQGAGLAAMLSMLNVFLFYINIPVASVGLAIMLGRKPYADHVRPSDYYRDGALVGAIIVGATTCFFGFAISLAGAIGAALTGMLIGALAGLVSTLVYKLIVKPEQQLLQHDFSTFE